MEKFQNLPRPAKITVGVFGAGGLMGAGLALGSGGRWKWYFLLALLILLVLVVGGYLLWKVWKKRKKAGQFRKDFGDSNTPQPREISDPGQRARLDDLRKKFEAGVEAYRSRGKDIYTLPWYAIVGEPGSGKTEAVRHSNVGFPPGMQDEFQGVGGTINMNWWFTNQAVLLDTAGRLMFEEVKPGETSEWKEFLKLLKKNRPNCPINGLFLVIPSDSLITNTAEEIARKAGKIAQQLDVIQRVLDVRFPVFVVVTKCDKINGFREFFDSLTDPQLQHQMLGWSNPDPLDNPFRPELVDQHLEQVAQRLRKRRLNLLRDPIASPDTAGGRRTDEVDALYALPQSLNVLGSRLRSYLQTIFIAGEWSAKPLFLRGIYFSSSMREGSALDQDLAEAIGVPVDALPEGKVWERDRAYFLRDLFVEKAFREKNLVTRATNTGQMLRRQQMALFGLGFIALAIFIAVAWLAMSSLRNNVISYSATWLDVSKAGWQTNKVWNQSILPLRDDGTFGETVRDQIEVGGEKYSVGGFHARLRDLAAMPVKRSWLAGGLASEYRQNSAKAQRIVFEGGVIKPLVEAARRKMISGGAEKPGDSAAARRQADALAQLVRLEADLALDGKSAKQFDLESAGYFLKSLLGFDTGQDGAVDTNLTATMVWTYAKDEDSRKAWPPRQLSGVAGPTNNLAGNPALRAGLERFIANATASIRELEINWGQVTELRARLREFEGHENKLFAAARAGDAKALDQAQIQVELGRKAINDLLAKLGDFPLFKGGVSLGAAPQNFRILVTNSAAASFKQVAEPNSLALLALPGHQLFKDIAERLQREQNSLAERSALTLRPDDLAEMKRFDELLLAKLADGSLAFEMRADLYQKAATNRPSPPFSDPKVRLVGLRGGKFEELAKELARLKSGAAAYAGPSQAGFVIAASNLLHRAELTNLDDFAAAYVQKARGEVIKNARFPLLRDAAGNMTADDIAKVVETLTFIAGDMAAFNGSATALSNLKDRPDWKEFTVRFTHLNNIAKLLPGEGVTPGKSKIVVRKWDMQNLKERWREPLRHAQLFSGSTPAAGRTQIDSGDRIELGEVPVDKGLALAFFQKETGGELKRYSVEAWGPFSLILKQTSRTPKANTFEVDWKIDDAPGIPDKQGIIPLEVIFDGPPLPGVESWPARDYWQPR